MRGNSFLPPAGPGGSLFAGGGAGGLKAPPAKGFGAALGGTTGGKNSKQENLHSPHSGLRSTITGGDPMDRAMGHYGKGAGSLTQVRGGAGGMKRNPRSGGIGPGPMSTPGTASDYSMTNPDLE